MAIVIIFVSGREMLELFIYPTRPMVTTAVDSASRGASTAEVAVLPLRA